MRPNLLQLISSTKWCSSFQAGNVLILVSFEPKADLARLFRASHQLSHCRQPLLRHHAKPLPRSQTCCIETPRNVWGTNGKLSQLLCTNDDVGWLLFCVAMQVTGGPL